MNRLFGKGKDKAPPPNLGDQVANVSDICFPLNIQFHYFVRLTAAQNPLIRRLPGSMQN